jgi:hypothetical protein
VADLAAAPEENGVLSLAGRALLAVAVTGLMLALCAVILMWIRVLPQSLGHGLFAALSTAVAILGLLCYGRNPLGVTVGVALGLIVTVLRVVLLTSLQAHHLQIVDAELALVGAFLIGTGVANALPDGLWALRIGVGGGAFQFLYFRMGYGPGSVGRLAFAPVAPDGLQAVWGMAQRPLLGYGTQFIDLVFIALIASLALRGQLRPIGTFAAITVATLAAAVLTSATGGPAPALPWLAALLYLFQAVEYDPLPPIEQRVDDGTPS